MSATFKWKLLLGFVLVFLAGATAGSYLAANHSRHLRAGLTPHHHSLAERMRNRMQSRLDLTPEQVKRTGPIFEEAAKDLEEIRTDTKQRVQKVFAEAEKKLQPELTETQRAKLDQLKKERPLLQGPGSGSNPPNNP